MKINMVLASALVATSFSVLAFPFTNSRGGSEIDLRLIDGKCMPDTLVADLNSNAFFVHRPSKDGRPCCPLGLAHSSPLVVEKSVWEKIRPYAATSKQQRITEAQACAASPMTEEEATKLSTESAKKAAAEARRKQEDEKRPLPANWRQLKASTHPADASLVKSIESMDWWNACAAWGREARAQTLGRRGSALRDYLLHDRTINDIDLASVRGRSPAVGQTTCGVYAVLGLPEKTNTTERASGVQIQMVYRDRGMYIYATGSPGNHNGIVTSISR